MTTKKLLLWLSIATAIGTLLGAFGKWAYDKGCQETKVEQVSQATSELFIDVKEIKKDVGELKTDVAVMKNGISDIKSWIKPNKEAFNLKGK